jgi:hypothetical protein
VVLTLAAGGTCNLLSGLYLKILYWNLTGGKKQTVGDGGLGVVMHL